MPRVNKTRFHKFPWTPSEIERLRDLAHRECWPTITEILNREYGTARSRHGVRRKAIDLGISIELSDPFWSWAECFRFFGCSSDAFIHLEEAGMLTTEFVPPGAGGRGRHGHRRVRESALEAFIRAYPWAYDPEYLVPREHRLARIARVLARRNPWLTSREAAPRAGVSPNVFSQALVRYRLPHKLRVLGSQGGGRTYGRGVVVVQSHDIEVIKEAMAQRRAAARAQTLAHFRAANQRKAALARAA